MNRQIARDALAKLKAPAHTQNPSPAASTLTTRRVIAPTDEPRDLDPATHFSVALPIELLSIIESKGGEDALAALVKAHSESNWLPKE